MSSNIKVFVRTRPLSSLEVAQRDKQVVKCVGKVLTIRPGDSKDTKDARRFQFDGCFDSSNAAAQPCSQAEVFEHVGAELIENAWAGFNVTVFAYGQTGSGKTHGMIGPPSDPGLIPRICRGLYARMEENNDPNCEFFLSCSLLEVYNESIYDLLKPQGDVHSGDTLRIRDHPVTGPYVEGLTKIQVKTLSELLDLVRMGFNDRTTHATALNEHSSRSHAVFTLTFTQRSTDPLSGLHFDRVSNINLVDLAGSERVKATKAEGARLKEAGEINKSLFCVSRVVTLLSDGKNTHIPYRDSQLTWLLRESLGGNAKTVILAALSPSESSYEESLSTLRYASRAKRIVNVAMVNEDANAKLISSLREELRMMREQLKHAKGTAPREADTKAAPNPFSLDHASPYLLNLNKEVLQDEGPGLVVPLEVDSIHIFGSSAECDIVVPQAGILPKHGYLKTGVHGTLLHAYDDAEVYVDNERVLPNYPRALANGALLLFGKTQLFWFKEAPLTEVSFSCSERRLQVWKPGDVDTMLRDFALGRINPTSVPLTNGLSSSLSSDADDSEELTDNLDESFDEDDDAVRHHKLANGLVAPADQHVQEPSGSEDATTGPHNGGPVGDDAVVVVQGRRLTVAELARELEETRESLSVTEEGAAELRAHAQELVAGLDEAEKERRVKQERVAALEELLHTEAIDVFISSAIRSFHIGSHNAEHACRVLRTWEGASDEGVLFVARNYKDERAERILQDHEKPIELKKSWVAENALSTYSFHFRHRGRLRVHTSNEAYKTLFVPVEVTVLDICALMAEKMNLDTRRLALTFEDLMSGSGPRDMGDDEQPLLLLRTIPLHCHLNVRVMLVELVGRGVQS